MHAELLMLGFDGSYNRVAAFARAWAARRHEAEQTTGRGTFSHSRAFVLRAYLLQTHEMLFDAHNYAFEVLGGVPRRGIYDNMKTAVDKVRRGKERDMELNSNARSSSARPSYERRPPESFEDKTTAITANLAVIQCRAPACCFRVGLISQLLLSDLLGHAGRIWDHLVRWARDKSYGTPILNRREEMLRRSTAWKERDPLVGLPPPP
jgi:hypothetical protein